MYVPKAVTVTSLIAMETIINRAGLSHSLIHQGYSTKAVEMFIVHKGLSYSGYISPESLLLTWINFNPKADK